MKSLKEVEKIVGLKRRAIQEYENKDLVKPTTKNKYGHLLYDADAIEKLWQLRFYKELGYNGAQIKKIVSDKNYNADAELEKVIKELKKKRENIDNMIRIAKVIQDTGLKFNSLKNSILGIEQVKSDKVFGILAATFDTSAIEVEFEDMFNLEIFTEDEFEQIFEELKKILNDYDLGKVPTDEDVQRKMETIHTMAYKALTESVMFLRLPLLYLNPESKIAVDLAQEIGAEKVEYIRKVLECYCECKGNNIADRRLIEIFDNIGKLGGKKYSINSNEVQAEVKKIHEFFGRMNILTEAGKIMMIKHFSNILGSDAYKDVIDSGAKRGVAWFTSRAIEIYCENL